MKKAILAAVALAAAVPAGAVTTVNNTGNTATPGGLLVFQNFNTTPANGTTVFSGSVDGVALRPTGSTGNFGAVQGGTTQTFTFAQPARVFGLLAGSVDAYNRLTLTFANGLSESFDGQGSVNANAFFTFSRDLADSRIVSVTLGSDQNSFEFDNLAIGGVPEPTTWAMMILGFGVIGSAVRRRRTVTARLNLA